MIGEGRDSFFSWNLTFTLTCWLTCCWVELFLRVNAAVGGKVGDGGIFIVVFGGGGCESFVFVVADLKWT